MGYLRSCQLLALSIDSLMNALKNLVFRRNRHFAEVTAANFMANLGRYVRSNISLKLPLSTVNAQSLFASI